MRVDDTFKALKGKPTDSFEFAGQQESGVDSDFQHDKDLQSGQNSRFTADRNT